MSSSSSRLLIDGCAHLPILILGRISRPSYCCVFLFTGLFLIFYSCVNADQVADVLGNAHILLLRT